MDKITLKHAKELSAELYPNTNSTKYPKPGTERFLYKIDEFCHSYSVWLKNSAGKLSIRIYWSR